MNLEERIENIVEHSMYWFLGAIAMIGVFITMSGFGLAGKGVYPDSLNLILIGGVVVGTVAGWIFREISAGLWGSGKLGDQV